jgi:O-antigen/teichoic acid export membrane protein
MSATAQLCRSVQNLAARAGYSSVTWFWGMNIFRLFSGILLLPLLWRLPAADLGFYFFLVSLSAIAPLVDFGLLTAIDRNVAYAMAGAKTLRAYGPPDVSPTAKGPNYVLLWKLLHTTRYLYRILAVSLFVLLGTVGTLAVYGRVAETSNPQVTWIAWALTLLCAVLEVYAGWWNIFLRGMNHVLRFAQFTCLSLAIKFLLAYVLLLSGAGLLAVPLASFFAMAVQRQLSRSYCLKLLEGHTPAKSLPQDKSELLRTLWPGSWRVGIHLMGVYLATHATTLLCVNFLGLIASAQYGLSLQIITFLAGISQVWLSVKWPRIAQLWAKSDFAALHELLRNRLWLHHLTFTSGALVLIPVMPLVVHWLAPGKSLLPAPWLALLCLLYFLESQMSIWGTLILTSNRMPFLWAFLIANGMGLLFALILLHSTTLGAGALVLGPLICGLIYNYWKWPREGSRLMGISWVGLMLRRPRRAKAEQILETCQ